MGGFWGKRDPSGGRVLNPASLRCLLGSGGSDFSPPAAGASGTETLMIWQLELHRGGENALLLGGDDAPVRFYCSPVGPSGVLLEPARDCDLIHEILSLCEE